MSGLVYARRLEDACACVCVRDWQGVKGGGGEREGGRRGAGGGERGKGREGEEKRGDGGKEREVGRGGCTMVVAGVAWEGNLLNANAVSCNA